MNFSVCVDFSVNFVDELSTYVKVPFPGDFPGEQPGSFPFSAGRSYLEFKFAFIYVYLDQYGVCLLQTYLVRRAIIFSFSGHHNPLHLPIFSAPLPRFRFHVLLVYNIYAREKIYAGTPYASLCWQASAV